jgi:hypothetical protein
MERDTAPQSGASRSPGPGNAGGQGRPGPGRPGSGQPGSGQPSSGRTREGWLPTRLPDDPLARAWVIRGLLALAAGLAVGIWLDWRLGLTAAAVVAIADVTLRARHTSVISPTSRTNYAQRKTRRQLAKLVKSGWVTLNRRAIPGSDEVIDHLVIGPAGVFAIDSEQWDKRLQIRTWNGLDIFHGPYSHTARLEHAQWEAMQATRRISNTLRHQVLVRPAMVVYGPKVPWTVARILGVDVFAGDRLLKYLRHEARAKAKVAERLDPSQVTLIAEAAEKALPPLP